MSNTIQVIEILVTTLAAVAFTFSSAVVSAVVVYSKRQNLTEHLKEMKIAAVAMGFAAVYLWAIFFELISR